MILRRLFMVRKFLKSLLSLFLIAVIATGISVACFFFIPENKGNITPILLHRFMRKNNVNGMMIVSDNTGKPITISHGINRGEVETDIENNKLFPMASLQKLMTGIIIQRLIDQDVLSEDDRLSQFFPQVKGSNSITIHQLLTHTSGLREKGVKVSPYLKNEREQLQFCLKHYNFVNKKSWYYSNINFSFLTGIATQVTGRTYAELVDDVIKNPLRLDDTQSYQSVVNHDLVSPMRKNGKLNKINIFNQVSTAYGAGDFFTTPLNFWVLMRSFSKGYFFPTDEYTKHQNDAISHYYDGLYMHGRIVNSNGTFFQYSSFGYADLKTHDTMVLFMNNKVYSDASHVAPKAFEYYQKFMFLNKIFHLVFYFVFSFFLMLLIRHSFRKRRYKKRL